MNELKPCPFCGGKAVIDSPDMPYPNYFIRCTECRTQTQWYADKKKLVEFWNTRNEESDSFAFFSETYFSDINKAISDMIPVIDSISVKHGVTKNEAAGALHDFFTAMVKANYTDKEE